MKRKRRYHRRYNPHGFAAAKSHDLRGSSDDRRRRKVWMLRKFGDGEGLDDKQVQRKSKCPCTYCKKPLTYKTMQVDRIKPGFEGGTYRRENCTPSCQECNIMRYHKEGFGTSVGYRQSYGQAESNPRRRYYARAYLRSLGRLYGARGRKFVRS